MACSYLTYLRGLGCDNPSSNFAGSPGSYHNDYSIVTTITILSYNPINPTKLAWMLGIKDASTATPRSRPKLAGSQRSQRMASQDSKDLGEVMEPRRSVLSHCLVKKWLWKMRDAPQFYIVVWGGLQDEDKPLNLGLSYCQTDQMLAFKRWIDFSHGCHLPAASFVLKIWHASYESLAHCKVIRWYPPVEYVYIYIYFWYIYI